MGPMNLISRRDFLLKSAGVGGALMASRSVFAASRYRQIIGSNGDVRVGIIGIRSKGAQHIEEFYKIPGVRVVALCDADLDILHRETDKFSIRKEPVAAYQDLRRLLDDPQVDAVVIATPNHWHSLAAIWACQAGKDVYVEKPVSHTVWEGRKLVEAARKYNRIVQAGTQNRSDTGFREAIEFIRQGHIGKVLYAHGVWYKERNPIGRVTQPQPIPASVDYNLWTGPAKMQPLMRKRLHYDWHWFWEYGDGEMANIGVHQIDDCRFALNLNHYPKRLWSLGGRFVFDDDGETPNTHLTVLDYGDIPVIVQVRNLYRAKGQRAMDHLRGTRDGNVLQCEGGYFVGGRGGGSVYDNDKKRIKQFPGDGGGQHQANFIDAVRSRRVQDLHGEIEQGHITSALCHLANIAHRIGRSADVDEIKAAVKDSGSEAQAAVESVIEHLLRNEVDLKKQPLTLGPWLAWDAEKERCVGPFAGKANKYLSRKKYRKPFVIPKNV
ncbi:MAG: Inositol 2-dehydrogenase [bacterium ADurb.Bin478]|nr:MAG: Inositol 2-dehydrogenase [bacterium ADurb.Bin478]